jgi:phosphoglucan,water dikinase
MEFMQSNNHTRNRNGKWDTSGLCEAAAALVGGDQGGGSWRQKLEVVDSLIGAGGRADSDALAYCAVYLAWIGSGAIRCVEDGSHHRPCRHAELARSIFIAVDNLQVRRP